MTKRSDWRANEPTLPARPGAEPGGPATQTPQAEVSYREPTSRLDERFRTLGPLGEGGMSVVDRVLDTNLGRQVAMKLLRDSLAADQHQVRGFLAEAQVTAQLDHPNIPPIFEIGVDAGGTRYFTMKLLRGENLADWAARRKDVGVHARLQAFLPIFVKVCEAVGFAHHHGVVHRDIKPPNVMVGAFGEVHLVDWGVYQLLPRERPSGPVVAGLAGERSAPHPAPAPDEQPAPTERGWTQTRMGGTLQYMAPEQAQGRLDEIDQRTDIFGLGGLLYFILVGRGPYSGYPTPEAFDRARRGDFVRPQEAVPGQALPEKLCAITERALSRDPADRHQTALELKSEVERFLGGGFQLPLTSFAPGTVIVREGDEGHAAYIIVQGHCVATRAVGGEPRELRRMGPGTVFGEMTLLSPQPRTATVTALDEVSAWVVTREQLDAEVGDTWLEILLRTLVERFREADLKLMQRGDV